jgi:hypothetical protein
MAYAPGVPRIARAQARVMHPKDFGHPVSIPHPSRGGIPQAGGRAGGGGGVGRGFGGGQPSAGGGGIGDPAITGRYNEEGRTNTFLGMPFGGVHLNAQGQADKADNDLFQKFIGARQDALNQGQSPVQANRAGAAAVGGVSRFAQLVSAHPDAQKMLANVDAFNNYFNGGGQNENISYQRDNEGHIVPIRMDTATGEANPDDLKAFNVAQDKGRSDAEAERAAGQKPQLITTRGTDAQGRPTTTSNVLQSDGHGGFAAVPVAGSTGLDKTSGKEAAASGLQVPSDLPGVSAQWNPANRPNGKVTSKDITELTAGISMLSNLGDMQKASSIAGIGKGPIATLGGQYFGINGKGAAFQQAQDNIRSNASQFAGSGYKAATENFMKGISSASDAPSYIMGETSRMMQSIRQRVQSLADNLATRQQAPLDQGLENKLEGVGVYSNGYQNQKTMLNGPANQAAMWKQRNFPQSMGDGDKIALLQDFAQGKITDPADKTAVDGMRKQENARAQALRQQQTATQAATAAQAQPAPSPAAPPQNPATQQNQPPTQTPGTPLPATPEQVTPAPAPQPAGAPASLEAPSPAEIAPQGVPQPGIPGTNGQTPVAPPNPLPQVSQTLQTNGNVPTPAAQPAQAASPVGQAVQQQQEGQADQQMQDEQGQTIPIPPAQPAQGP